MQAINKRQEDHHGHLSHKKLPPLQLHVHHHQYQRLKIGREDGHNSKHRYTLGDIILHQCDCSRATTQAVPSKLSV